MDYANKAKVLIVSELWSRHRPNDLYTSQLREPVAMHAHRYLHEAIDEIACGRDAAQAVEKARSNFWTRALEWKEEYWLYLNAGMLGWATYEAWSANHEAFRKTDKMFNAVEKALVEILYVMIDHERTHVHADEPDPHADDSDPGFPF